jgi:hypothetical protein
LQQPLKGSVANLAAPFGQGYPTAGGLSQSSVNGRAGARTPLALVVAPQQELEALGIQLRAVEAHASVRDLRRADGTEIRAGELNRKLSLDDVVESFLADRPAVRPIPVG